MDSLLVKDFAYFPHCRAKAPATSQSVARTTLEQASSQQRDYSDQASNQERGSALSPECYLLHK